MISGFFCKICGEKILSDDDRQLTFCGHYPPRPEPAGEKLVDDLPVELRDLLGLDK